MIKLPQETLDARAARLSASFRTILPDGPGPFPVVVMLHGCGRVQGPQDEYGAVLAQAGIASLVVDSYTARRIDVLQASTLVCTGLSLWGRERAGDLFAALHWLRRQPWADPERLGALGWSHGGWTVMDALSLTGQVARHAGLSDVGETPLAGLKAVVAVYPWCGVGSHTIARGWRTPVPGGMIVAERDTLAGRALPLRACRRLQEDGLAFDMLELPGATHSFDERDTLNPGFVYAPELARQAHGFARDTLCKHLLATR